MITSIKQLIQEVEKENDLFEVILQHEETEGFLSRSDMLLKMRKQLAVMESSVKQGIQGVESVTKLSGKDAQKLDEYLSAHNPLSGSFIATAVRNAIATNEVNAAMGLVCATPTAGSAGVVPGVLFALKQHFKATEDEMVRFLFVAGMFGLITANNASISGAMGGCQAEIGSASAMASAALVDFFKGDIYQVVDAFAMTLKNMLGLVCDPVAGLVEVPCVKRNALGASQAIVSADMALAGVQSRIPADEVIQAMYQIGLEMDPKYKETGDGGLAATATAKQLSTQILNQ